MREIIKVAILIPTLNIAGAEKFVVDLALNIDKNKYKVVVGVTHTYKETYFTKILLDNDIEIVSFGRLNMLLRTLKIRNFLIREKIDIVHSNLGSHLHSLIAVGLSSVKGRVFTFHSTAERSAGNNLLKKILYSISFKFMNFTPVAISDFVKRTIINEYNIPSKKIIRIFNGVDTEKFKPLKKSITESSNIKFVTTGTLYHIKNHELLIRAFAETNKAFPNTSLTIIGDGILRNELEKLIDSFGLRDNVKILGSVNNVSDSLQQADIYVMSSNIEGFSIATLEAMSCGLPIVTTNAGGIVDIVENGVNGIVTPVGNIESLSNAMIELILDTKLKEKMGKESRKKAEMLDVKSCAENYMEVYKNLMIS